jgi:hypothetical protein
MKAGHSHFSSSGRALRGVGAGYGQLAAALEKEAIKLAP